jgi:hypothetical protein
MGRAPGRPLPLTDRFQQRTQFASHAELAARDRGLLVDDLVLPTGERRCPATQLSWLGQSSPRPQSQIWLARRRGSHP